MVNAMKYQKEISIDALREGMQVVRFDKSGVYYPYYGKPLSDVNIIKSLKEEGVQYAYVIVESKLSSKKTVVNKSLKSEKKEQKTPGIDLGEDDYSSFADAPTIAEIKQAQEIHSRARIETKTLLSDIKMGKSIDNKKAEAVVDELVTHCLHSPSVFASMTRLKSFDDYTFVHSLNVSIISIAIARRLGKTAEELENIGLAGLLHDIGKMRVPDNILNKPGKLNDKEFAVMRRHPELGYDILNKTNVSDDIKDAVLQHHEKADGSGYPNGLFDRQISAYAKVLSIADVYDAVTSDRVYHAGRTPSEALKMIFEGSGKHFNETLVKFFINIMGVYPIGTLVMLDSNEIAIVFELSKSDTMRPKVLIITDENGKTIKPRLYDLTSHSIQTKRYHKKIISAINPKDYSIDSNEIIDKFVNSGARAS